MSVAFSLFFFSFFMCFVLQCYPPGVRAKAMVVADSMAGVGAAVGPYIEAVSLELSILGYCPLGSLK